jgi:hypothetical protein
MGTFRPGKGAFMILADVDGERLDLAHREQARGYTKFNTAGRRG